MRDFGYSEEGEKNSVGDYQLWLRVIRYSSAHRYALLAAVLISGLITWATLSLPHIIQLTIDNYILNEDISTSLRLSGISVAASKYGFFILLIFSVSFVQIRLLEWVGQSVMHTIRQQLFRHLLDLDLAFFNKNPTGRLVTRLTNDIQNMNEMFTSVIVTLFNDLLRLFGILILLFWMNPRLAFLMALFIPLAMGVTSVFARMARERFRAIRTQLARLNSNLSEILTGMDIIQMYNREKTCRTTYEDLSKGYLHRTLSQIKLFGAFMPLTEFMSSAAVALILWYGGGEVLRNRLSLGELVAFLSYMRLFFQPLRELSQKYSVVQSAMASAERIFSLLDTPSTILSANSKADEGGILGKLVFEDLSFGYEKEKQVLKNVSLTIEPGQTVAMVGTTGSGKTTLINLLLRFYEPESGEIYLDNRAVHEFQLDRLRTIVGVILQDVLLLQDTLLANIVMNSGTSRQKVEEILHNTGMNRFVQKLPQGLDTLIGDGGIDLSTGEKQLLSFARVLCRNPKILILDEATAAIDTESENILEEAIDDAFQNRTSLIIAHRLSTIRRADRIVVMDNGRIIEQGSHEELVANNSHYAHLVAMDLQT